MIENWGFDRQGFFFFEKSVGFPQQIMTFCQKAKHPKTKRFPPKTSIWKMQLWCLMGFVVQMSLVPILHYGPGSPVGHLPLFTAECDFHDTSQRLANRGDVGASWEM